MAGVAAVATIFSTAFGIKTSRDAAKDQRRAAAESEALGRENAAAIEAETAESARRLSKQQAETESLAQAKAAASGAGGKSQTTFLESMVGEHGRQLDWLKQSGRSQASIARRAGASQGRVGRSQAKATEAAGVGNFLQSTGTFASQSTKAGWWDTKTT